MKTKSQTANHTGLGRELGNSLREFADFARHPVSRGLAVVAATDLVGEVAVSKLHNADPVRHNIISHDTLLMAPLTYLVARGVRKVCEWRGVSPESTRWLMASIALPVGFTATKGVEVGLGMDPMPGGVPGINIGELAIASASGAPAVWAADFKPKDSR
jgi:hypothetical protein